MSEAKFTPGPWKVERFAPYALWVETGDNTAVICDMTGDDGKELQVEPTAEQEANARLIAASPRMYAALEMIANMDAGYASKIARTVIAELEGGT